MRQALPLLGLIGRTLNLEEAHGALAARYGAETPEDSGDVPVSGFRQMPNLAKALDANGNGQIERDELARLNELSPHIQLRAAFGEIGDGPPLSLVAMHNDAGEKIPVEAADKNGFHASLAGVRLEIIGGNANFGGYDYKATAQALINQYDTDKNGYLDEKDAPANQAFLKQNFKTWDADENGQVVVDEIKMFYELQQRPQNYRASVAAADMGGSLLTAMDTSGDNRLGLREMRTAAERLKTFDKDGDGAVSRAEVPSTIRFAVARGGFAYSFLGGRGMAAWGGGQGGFVVRGGQPQPQQAHALEWFTRMDRNGDGDVTLKEFPGDEEQFKTLDTNGDGFLERKEAESIKP
jgi:Ca2+-binding EF-hand superfamily protein